MIPIPIMVTDTTPIIVRVNRAFSRVTGYGADEVLGCNPNLLASGRQSPDFYQNMWEAIICQGSWEGEIWNRRKNGQVFPEALTITALRDEQGRVRHYIGTFRDVTTRMERESRLQHLSQHDPLTDLPNRTLFLDRLDQSIRRASRLGQSIGLLFLDLDNFKSINDTAGHLSGDHVLREVASRLTGVVRDMDTVARMGGDEFAILVTEIGGPEHLAGLCARVLEVISRPVESPGGSHRLHCSIGIGIGPKVDDSPERLISRADAAMYLAKRGGGHRYVFADS